MIILNLDEKIFSDNVIPKTRKIENIYQWQMQMQQWGDRNYVNVGLQNNSF